jgi:hypothetical protein
VEEEIEKAKKAAEATLTKSEWKNHINKSILWHNLARER